MSHGQPRADEGGNRLPSLSPGYKKILKPQAIRGDTGLKEKALAKPNSDDPRERILRAAATLFAHKGYAGTSTREITEAASVTKPTIYYHFKSKRDLYLTILGEAMRIFHDRLNSSATRFADMRTCLRSLLFGIESLVRNHPEAVQLIFISVRSSCGLSQGSLRM